MKPALLVIDMQKAYYKWPLVKESMINATEYINASISLFRKEHLPIFWIYNSNKKEGPTEGQDDFNFIDQLSQNDNEIKIIKEYGNSFNKTKLIDHIKKQNIDTIFITGFCAEYCVLSTYRGALDLDLNPIIIRGSIASDNIEHIRFVEQISDIISIGLVKQYISSSK